MHEGPLDEAGIAVVPAGHGAYRLWQASRVLFVGVASAPHTQGASHFECLVAPTAAEVHALYLLLYGSSGLREGAPRVRI